MVLVFLQTWRASVIPLLALPVSLVGTFAIMLLLGFSLNTLSLFGLVLAIGIVVDDAIVVVENVERNIALGYEPPEATRRAMAEVSGSNPTSPARTAPQRSSGCSACLGRGQKVSNGPAARLARSRCQC